MVKQIVGGVVALVIGGTTFAVSQTSVVKNFSKNTGMNQQQAQQYINNIPQKDMETFSKVGQGLVSDGYLVIQTAQKIDCTDYTYQWVTSSLGCTDGQNQLQAIGGDEITLGNCYQSLGTNLGDTADSKINECITDGKTVKTDYSLPIVGALLDSNTVSNLQDSIAYNQSVLEAALQSN